MFSDVEAMTSQLGEMPPSPNSPNALEDWCGFDLFGLI